MTFHHLKSLFLLSCLLPLVLLQFLPVAVVGVKTPRKSVVTDTATATATSNNNKVLSEEEKLKLEEARRIFEEDKIRAKGKGPFTDALNEDDEVAMRRILQEGLSAEPKLNINAVGKGGQTPLVAAVLMGKPNAVKVLLEYGADYSIPEKDGYTVMHAAAFQGRADIVPLLANHVDEEGNKVISPFNMHKDGFHPFHRACWGRQPRHSETVQAFLDLGVPYDLKAENGKTCFDMTQNDDTKYVLRKAKLATAEAIAAGNGPPVGGSSIHTTVRHNTNLGGQRRNDEF